MYGFAIRVVLGLGDGAGGGEGGGVGAGGGVGVNWSTDLDGLKDDEVMSTVGKCLIIWQTSISRGAFEQNGAGKKMVRKNERKKKR